MQRNQTGRLHSVESFGTVDGPGIRYVLFFQGCPLRCLYCHNRDTWERFGGRTVTVPELVREISAYLPYFRASGGGVTATGGEPLMQADFVAALFTELGRKKVHRALDTSGYAAMTDDVDRLLSETDLVLLDIKHMDDEVHRRLTGVPNGRILEFAREVDRRRIPIWIRHVIVQGFTDNADSATRLADFVATLDSVERVELLPYHELGKHKWEAMGVSYALENIGPPSPETMRELTALFRSRAISVTVAA